MTNLKSLSDGELLKIGKEKSVAERAITLEVINIIREVERRRLFLDLGYGSLFDYVTKELKFDESAALRRINAARLLRDLPEIEEKIQEGSLLLSTLSQAQVFFKKEAKLHKKLNLEEKKEVLLSLENKSYRETQKTLIKLSPEQKVLKESERVVGSKHTELKFIIDDKLYEDLEMFKSLISHKNPNPSYAELLSELLKIAFKTLRVKLPAAPQVQKDTGETKKESEISSKAETQESSGAWNRYIPAKIKQQVWLRDKAKCAFVNPMTNRRCDSTFQVQFHHELPFAKGVKHSIENIKLLCSQHNQQMAIKDFGKDKMQMFMKLQ